jgi:gamma-glutamyltranspeptidase/glutathione hydrolase
MTGIAGIFSMLYYDAATKKTTCVDAGWKAPETPLEKGTRADMKTGRAVAVPGFWAGFEAAHKHHSTRPIKEIMTPAIRYARDGFETHPFLWGEIFATCHRSCLTEQGREMFMPQNTLLRPGEKLYQKRAADTLERLSAEGSNFFYHGEFAAEHCRVVQKVGATLTKEDFASYQPVWLDPVWGAYRGYEITSGGNYLINAFKKIEQMDLKQLGPPTDSAESFMDLIRIANGFGRTRKKEDKDKKTNTKKKEAIHYLGLPQPFQSAGPVPGSCHVTVVDKEGNIASILHTSNAFPWDNGLFANGVTICSGGGYLALSKPKSGRRAVSFSTAAIPSIIFKDKNPILTSGSPSASLFANIVQNTINILDFNIPIEESVNRPRFGGFSYEKSGAFFIEADFPEDVRKQAEAKKMRFDVVNPWNWHHGSFEGVYIDPETSLMRACGDPRRCSKAEGL